MTTHRPLGTPPRYPLKAMKTDRLRPVHFPAFRSFVGAPPKHREFEHWHNRVIFDPTARVSCAACFERGMAKAAFEQRQIDLIVVHPLTGRPLGRPWLTVHLHRVTRIVLDVRLNFEVYLRS